MRVTESVRRYQGPALAKVRPAMSHHYAFTTKGVLRHLSWDFIQGCCQSNGLFPDLECLQTKKPDLEALTEAIHALPAERRVEVEQDLHDIYDLADDDGVRLIYEEARARGEDLTSILTEITGATTPPCGRC
jgi:hypothetical protein